MIEPDNLYSWPVVRRVWPVVAGTRATTVVATLCAVVLLFATQLALATEIDTPQRIEQRKQFLAAQAALEQGDSAAFDQSLQELGDYPLIEYLRFEQLQQRWKKNAPDKQSVAELNAFEQRTGDISMTRRLTNTLQERFAATKQWSLFLGVSESRLAASMACTRVRAEYELKRNTGFSEDVLALWEQPVDHPAMCASVLKSIEANHTPPIASIWERIYQSMEAGKPDYAEPVLAYLASGDRQRVQNWMDARQDPGAYLLSGKLREDNTLNRRIIADLIVAWSRDDTVAAVEHWLQIRDDYVFFADRYYDTHRAIVMRAAYRRLPQAQGWLADTQEREDDLEMAEWRVRTAMYVEDWAGVLEFIARLPSEEQQEDHWAYWVARAHEQLGNEALAQSIYKVLSTLQSYHGFLAADKLGADYAIYDEPVSPAAGVLDELRSDAALVRAYEFHQVDLDYESRREWNNWIINKDNDVKAASAVLASEWGLDDRAIYSAGQSGEEYRRAISLRFPLVYRSEVAKASTEYRIEPAWIFGVMRRESAYIPKVQSPAGAVGLMQLMPNTAKYVAQLDGDDDWRGDLTDAATNIDFGTHYLRYVMDKFSDHEVLATASYNAGPHRVDAWLRENEVEADLWIDTILFTETRRYVRAVMAYAAIYEYHLRGEAERLSRKLRTVPASPNV